MGHPGKEVASEPVTIDTKRGICMSKEAGIPENNPYMATIRYQGTDKLVLNIPHIVGFFCGLHNLHVRLKDPHAGTE